MASKIPFSLSSVMVASFLLHLFCGILEKKIYPQNLGDFEEL